MDCNLQNHKPKEPICLQGDWLYWIFVTEVENWMSCVFFLKMAKSQSGWSLGSRGTNLKKSHEQSKVLISYIGEVEWCLFKLLRFFTALSVGQISIIDRTGGDRVYQQVNPEAHQLPMNLLSCSSLPTVNTIST